jgi:hypothetical protein
MGPIKDWRCLAALSTTAAIDIVGKSLKGTPHSPNEFGLYRVGKDGTILARLHDDTKILPLVQGDPGTALCVRRVVT